MDSFCGISRIYFVREIFLRILNISLKHLLTLEKIFTNTFLFLSQKLCKAKYVNIIVGILSSLKSIFLFKIRHRAFRRPQGHLIGFRASFNILLKTVCALDLQDLFSFIQDEVRGQANSPVTQLFLLHLELFVSK